MSQRIAIIDYGMGNLHSAQSAIEHVAPDAQVDVTADRQLILEADRVVFPGVGAIRDCMAEIKRLKIDEVVKTVVQDRPVLAICVGMQALMERSEENGGVDCIGLLEGDVEFFGRDLKDANGEKLKVPHMGWSPIRHIDHPMWQGIDDQQRFYFVHSYYVHAKNEALVAAHCDYGINFHAALAQGSLFTTQFHPEKSDTNGLQLLKNFVNWDGKA